jgi:coenzyme F420-0:L-glutamate ligase / coenzyme F420-1:gamma-L-glutamate ligase
MSEGVQFIAVRGLPEVEPGTDLAALITAALATQQLTLHARDVLVVAQKVVSKAEGRLVELDGVSPSKEAQRLAQVTGKDPRIVELILGETDEIVRAAPRVLIVRHRLGYVMANAGVDRSNVPVVPREPARRDETPWEGVAHEETPREGPTRERALLLPRDPDASAAELRRRLMQHLDAEIAIIVSDSFGRPWRRGVQNVALGSAGLPSLIDRRGERDREGRALEVTEVAFADAIAAGAALVMGEAAESMPVVLVRGLEWQAPERDASALLRPKAEDLFR